MRQPMLCQQCHEPTSHRGNIPNLAGTSTGAEHARARLPELPHQHPRHELTQPTSATSGRSGVEPGGRAIYEKSLAASSPPACARARPRRSARRTAVEPIQTENIDPRAPNSLNTGASEASVGIGYANDATRRFGEYNGIKENGAYGLLDFNWVKRNDETGTWTRIFGRDVGLDDRQLRFEQQRQGNWGYSIDYSRIPRFEPLTTTTAVGGIGTNNLVVPATLNPTGWADRPPRPSATSSDSGSTKFISGNSGRAGQVPQRGEGRRADLRSRKPPAPPECRSRRRSARSSSTPEPIDATTRQVEAKVNYNGGALLLQGGYYGTMYNNKFDSGLIIAGGNTPTLANPRLQRPVHADRTAAGQPVAPALRERQLHFTQTTRSTFKLAYQKENQDAAFVSGVNVPLSPAAAAAGGEPERPRGHQDGALRNHVAADPEALAGRRRALRGPRRQDPGAGLFPSPATDDHERRERAALHPDHERQGGSRLPAARELQDHRRRGLGGEKAQPLRDPRGERPRDHRRNHLEARIAPPDGGDGHRLRGGDAPGSRRLRLPDHRPEQRHGRQQPDRADLPRRPRARQGAGVGQLGAGQCASTSSSTPTRRATTTARAPDRR
jgi:hypothetical protein